MRNLSLPTSLSVGEDECDAHLEDEGALNWIFLVKEAVPNKLSRVSNLLPFK